MWRNHVEGNTLTLLSLEMGIVEKISTALKCVTKKMVHLFQEGLLESILVLSNLKTSKINRTKSDDWNIQTLMTTPGCGTEISAEKGKTFQFNPLRPVQQQARELQPLMNHAEQFTCAKKDDDTIVHEAYHEKKPKKLPPTAHYHGEMDGELPEEAFLTRKCKRKLGTFAKSINQTKDNVVRAKAFRAVEYVQQLQVLTTYAKDITLLAKCPPSDHFLICFDSVMSHPHARPDGGRARKKMQISVLCPPVDTDQIDPEEVMGRRLEYLGKAMRKKERDRYLLTTDKDEYYESIYGTDASVPAKVKSREAVVMAFSSNMLAASTAPAKTPLRTRREQEASDSEPEE
jgi:hypothetical protein